MPQTESMSQSGDNKTSWTKQASKPSIFNADHIATWCSNEVTRIWPIKRPNTRCTATSRNAMRTTKNGLEAMTADQSSVLSSSADYFFVSPYVDNHPVSVHRATTFLRVPVDVTSMGTRLKMPMLHECQQAFNQYTSITQQWMLIGPVLGHWFNPTTSNRPIFAVEIRCAGPWTCARSAAE